MTATLNIKLPNSWFDLTEDQAAFVSRLLFMQLSETDIITRCFLKFAGVKILSRDPEWLITKDEPDGIQVYWFRTKELGKFWLDVDMASTLIHHLDFIIEDISLFKNPAMIGKYTGCNYRLYGLCLAEWIMLDQFYIAFAKTQRVEFLDKMLAVTYRKDGEKYSEEEDISKLAMRFRRIKARDKYIVFLWYTSVKMWLKIKYYYLFSTGSETGEQQPADEYVLGLLSSLNDGVVANNPQIKLTPAHEVFYELNRRIERQQTKM